MTRKILIKLIITIWLTLISTSVFPTTKGVVSDAMRYESINLPNTQVRHIESKKTKVDYKIYVDIPADYYQHPNKYYPALFLLDADYSFPITKSIVEHLADRHRLPAMFVFGIAYDGPPRYKLNRTRDYTPTFVATGGYGPQYQKVSGGGPDFYHFLKTELIPYLTKCFRLNQQRTLVGHSFGGLFATWLSQQDAKIFSSYIIVSPSLWYDQHDIMKRKKQQAKTAKLSKAQLFFVVGDKEDGGMYRMVSHLKEYVKNITQIPHIKQKVTLVVLANEDHDTLFPVALTRGLLSIYGKKSDG